MIDFFLRYTDEAAAKADAKLLAEAMGQPVSQDWRHEHTLPNVKAWRVSLDTIVDGKLVHNYFGGWFVIVALTYVEPVLLNSPALQFALDREACNRGENFVIKNNIGTLIKDVACEPIFAGSTYPMGNWKQATQLFVALKGVSGLRGSVS
jgi:hypothetical protein